MYIPFLSSGAGGSQVRDTSLHMAGFMMAARLLGGPGIPSRVMTVEHIWASSVLSV